MMCPKCGAWSEVAETRKQIDLIIRRRRKCANNHSFTTFEVYPAMVASKRDVRKAAAKASTNAKLWQRDRQIRADSRSTAEVARHWGLTTARIRQIRKAKE